MRGAAGRLQALLQAECRRAWLCDRLMPAAADCGSCSVSTDAGMRGTTVLCVRKDQQASGRAGSLQPLLSRAPDKQAGRSSWWQTAR